MEDSQKLREDFVVRIGPGPDGLRVRVVDSPAGEASEEPFRIPFTRDELERLERRFAAAGRERPAGPEVSRRNLRPLPEPAEPRWAEAAGEALFRALLPGELLRLWRRSVWGLDQPDAGRRRLLLRLRFDLAGRPAGAASDTAAAGGELLHRLPWELLYDPEEDRFLARSRRFSVARYLEVPRPRGPGPVTGAPAVLAVAASPRGGAALPPLDLSRELAGVRRALKAGFELRVVERATLGALGEAMDRPTHVLHFMGHGDFDAATGEGALVMEGDDHRSVSVTSGRLIEEIGESLTGVRLVVLNACRTAEAAASSPYAGVATALVARGVGAVVAMRHPITDAAALAFSASFYERLAAGADVDEAVREGRRAIRELDRDSAEWAIPALFLRSSGGPLFVRRPEERTRRRRLARAGAGAATLACAALALWLILAPSGTFGNRAGGLGGAGADAPTALGLTSAGVRHLPLGEPVRLPEIRAVVSAELANLLEQEMVRLTVAPDGGGSAVKAVFPGRPAEFPLPLAGGAEEPREVLEIQVLAVDRGERTVAVRALRRSP